MKILRRCFSSLATTLLLRMVVTEGGRRYHASICEEHKEVRENEILAMVINFKRTGDVVQLWNNKQQNITSLHVDRESSDPFALKREPIIESMSLEERGL